MLKSRFESGDDDWFIIVAGNELIRLQAYHHGNVTWPNKPIQLHVWIIQENFDRWRDCDVIAKEGKIGDFFLCCLLHAKSG